MPTTRQRIGMPMVMLFTAATWQHRSLPHQITIQQSDFVRDFIFLWWFCTPIDNATKEDLQTSANFRQRDDRAVTLSQIVHLTLRCSFEPDANFDKQRRLIACAPIP